MFAYDEENANDAIPMNTANFAPTFNEVQLLMNEYHLELNKNISIHNRVNELSLVIDDARKLIAEQLGVSPQEIALMRNGTEANNNVNNGQILNPTDEV
jgi:selenocysteine lyase/cysteine desulfurase